jgi:hypothetical protein
LKRIFEGGNFVAARHHPLALARFLFQWRAQGRVGMQLETPCRSAGLIQVVAVNCDSHLRKFGLAPDRHLDELTVEFYHQSLEDRHA